PSITLAFASASRSASISLINSIELLNLLGCHRLDPAGVLDLQLARHQMRADLQVCRGVLLPHLFNRGRSVLLKSAASASRKSLLNDLRVASNDPPGSRLVLPLMPRTRPGASILHCDCDALHAAAPPLRLCKKCAHG